MTLFNIIKRTVKNFNFEEYTNFDFKNNFKKIIKPHLTNEKVVKSIERAIIGYTHNKTHWPDSELYELESFYDYFQLNINM